jgi:hypothetical protein
MKAENLKSKFRFRPPHHQYEIQVSAYSGAYHLSFTMGMLCSAAQILLIVCYLLENCRYYYPVLALSMPPITKTTTIHSSCNCRNVEIEIQLQHHQREQHQNNANNDKADVINCHCSSCRKYHTSGFTSFLRVDKSQVTVRHGSNYIEKYRSECKELGPVERWFCKECSSKLLSMPLTDDTEKDSSDKILKDERKTTKCYVNLGPIQDDDQQEVLEDEKIISPVSLLTHWGKQLEREENNLHYNGGSGGGGGVWVNALPAPAITTNSNNNTYINVDIENELIDNPILWTGSCACGNCAYELTIDYSTELQHCYCHLCRELSGSGFMTWMPIEKQNFRWTNKKSLRLVRTTPFGRRHICMDCKGVMTIIYDEQPDHVWPSAGSLDDSSLPTNKIDMGNYLNRVCHICCRYQPTWLKIPNDGMEKIDDAC